MLGESMSSKVGCQSPPGYWSETEPCYNQMSEASGQKVGACKGNIPQHLSSAALPQKRKAALAVKVGPSGALGPHARLDLQTMATFKRHTLDHGAVEAVAVPPLREHSSGSFEGGLLGAIAARTAHVGVNKERADVVARVAKADVIQNAMGQLDFVFAIRALRRDDPPVLPQHAEGESLDDRRNDDERGLAGRWR